MPTPIRRRILGANRPIPTMEDSPSETEIRPYGIIKSPAQMRRIIDKYFKETVSEEKPPTIAGLSLALGFCNRQSLYDYEKKYPEFSYEIKRARSLIEVYTVELTMTKQSVAGPIFMLKNNHNYTDRVVLGQDEKPTSHVSGILAGLSEDEKRQLIRELLGSV